MWLEWVVAHIARKEAQDFPVLIINTKETGSAIETLILKVLEKVVNRHAPCTLLAADSGTNTYDLGDISTLKW